jgi:hypothetical protein
LRGGEIEERSLVVAEKRPRLCRDDNEKQNEGQKEQSKRVRVFTNRGTNSVQQNEKQEVALVAAALLDVIPSLGLIFLAIPLFWDFFLKSATRNDVFRRLFLAGRIVAIGGKSAPRGEDFELLKAFRFNELFGGGLAMYSYEGCALRPDHGSLRTSEDRC